MHSAGVERHHPIRMMSNSSPAHYVHGNGSPSGAPQPKGPPMSFWDFLWFFFWTYIFISFIVILFQMFADLFRDRNLNGWAKALWIIFLVFVPFLGALIYLVVRGRGMAERQAARMMVAQADNDAYIRTVASSSSPSATDDIAKAKALLDSGAISQTEYDALKARAIG
jgi:hypothetical protein